MKKKIKVEHEIEFDREFCSIKCIRLNCFQWGEFNCELGNCELFRTREGFDRKLYPRKGPKFRRCDKCKKATK